MALWRNTSYTWMNESPEESLVTDNSRATGTVLVDWSDRGQARRDFIGYPSYNVDISPLTGLPVAYISRLIPFQYPSPDLSSLWCQGAPKTVGAGKLGNDPLEGKLASYPHAFISLSFQAPGFFILPDDDVIAGSGPLVGYPDEAWWLANSSWVNTRNILRVTKPAGKFVTLRQNIALIHGYGDPAEAQPLNEGAPVQLGEAVYVYAWHQVPAEAYPLQAIAKCLGRINNATFDGFAAGTMLLETVDTRIEWSPFQQLQLTVSYQMRFHPNVNNAGVIKGWNSALGVFSKTLDYYPLSDGAGNPIFKSCDMSSLFRPDQS